MQTVRGERDEEKETKRPGEGEGGSEEGGSEEGGRSSMHTLYNAIIGSQWLQSYLFIGS